MSLIILDRWRYFAPAERDGQGHYGPPPGVTAAIDVSSLASLDVPAGEPHGWGMFRLDALPSDFGDHGGIVLSSEDIRDTRLDDKERQAIGDILGVVPEGDTLADWLLSLFTGVADPEHCRPLIPTHLRRLELWFGDLIHDRQFDPRTDPHWEKVRDGKVLYYQDEHHDFPIGAEWKDIPPIFAGLTSGQVWEQHRVAVNGRVPPALTPLNPQGTAYVSDEPPSALPELRINRTWNQYARRNYQQTADGAGFVLRVRDSSGAEVTSEPVDLANGWNTVRVEADGVERGVLVRCDPAGNFPAEW